MTIKNNAPVIESTQGKETAPIFTKDRFIAQAKQVFKQPPEIVSGALHDVNKPITLEQAKEKIDTYIKRPINNKGGK